MLITGWVGLAFSLCSPARSSGRAAFTFPGGESGLGIVVKDGSPIAVQAAGVDIVPVGGQVVRFVGIVAHREASPRSRPRGWTSFQEEGRSLAVLAACVISCKHQPDPVACAKLICLPLYRG